MPVWFDACIHLPSIPDNQSKQLKHKAGICEAMKKRDKDDSDDEGKNEFQEGEEGGRFFLLLWPTHYGAISQQQLQDQDNQNARFLSPRL